MQNLRYDQILIETLRNISRKFLLFFKSATALFYNWLSQSRKTKNVSLALILGRMEKVRPLKISPRKTEPHLFY